MTSVINIDGSQPLPPALQDQGEMETKVESSERACGKHGGICAICLDKIVLQETALVKDCEHAYCVTCILRWATYSKNPTCPQCKHPFEFLNIHRSLDGSSSSLRIGNRRWGNNGYVRAGHQEARPVHRSNFEDSGAGSSHSGAGSSREPKKKEAAKERTGRRAKRTLKREAADKAAAAKHQQHLTRLGRK
ncbi:hypothetical protein DKX38_014085 [Salix brachista]|uniref:RING-type domain-containing protein n=1 Tax=Salix brachista TaxID=2182728 RepID=A0A5N5LGD4_9ROSI|nr:hypothetical protein DKX38_014085 [Salix brachista]